MEKKSATGVNDFNKVLQDTVDYWGDIFESPDPYKSKWLGKRAAQRIAPNRNWDYPHIAGLEGYYAYPQLVEATKKVPGVSDSTDVHLVPRFRENINQLGGWSPVEDANGKHKIRLIPFPGKNQIQAVAAHEFGHDVLDRNRMFNSELNAATISHNALANRPWNQNLHGWGYKVEPDKEKVQNYLEALYYANKRNNLYDSYYPIQKTGTGLREQRWDKVKPE